MDICQQLCLVGRSGFLSITRVNSDHNLSTWSCLFTHTHTRLTALCPGLPGWAGTRSKTNLDFTEARDSEWQWHQLGHMQVCTSLQTDNHASTPPLSFLQAGCPSCRPNNSIKALKAFTVSEFSLFDRNRWHRKVYTQSDSVGGSRIWHRGEYSNSLTRGQHETRVGVWYT